MDDYVSIYKCRLCGRIIKGVHTGQSMAVKTTVDATNNEQKEGPMSPRLIEYHTCMDGSIGLTDFQGFKKTGDAYE